MSIVLVILFRLLVLFLAGGGLGLVILLLVGAAFDWRTLPRWQQRAR